MNQYEVHVFLNAIHNDKKQRRKKEKNGEPNDDVKEFSMLT